MRQGHAESWTMFPGLDPISVLKYVLMASCMLPCLLSITPQHVKNCQHLPFVDEEIKAKSMLAQLFEHFESNPDKLPIDYLETISKESVGRAVCDYISGMTDRYALDLYHEIFIPEVWRVK